MEESALTRVRNHLRLIEEHVQQSLEKAGRKNDEVRIMAVTKGFPRAVAEAGRAAGLTLFGENRVQEAEEKYGADRFDGELHLIGHLQRNKAKRAAELFACVQSIDKLETALELDRHASALGKKLPVLLQINTSGEESKSGFKDRDALFRELERIRALEALEIAGLMTIGPFTDNEGEIRRAFARLKMIFMELHTVHAVASVKVLSMGMSHDYAIAVEEGATMIRIGTALFGGRSV